MQIQITELNYGRIKFSGSYKDDWGNKKDFDSFNVKNTNKTKINISVWKNGIKMSSLSKKMNFEDGLIQITFGKNKFEIGKYKIIN